MKTTPSIPKTLKLKNLDPYAREWFREYFAKYPIPGSDAGMNALRREFKRLERNPAG